jgi:hypothetical protein
MMHHLLSRAPFANPSTVYCLQRVATKRFVALPCHDVSLHPTYAPLESVLIVPVCFDREIQ